MKMATVMYMFDLNTGEYTGNRPAQVVGGKELTQSSTAVTTAPPAEIPAGHVARWTGAAWEIVEDHRQHMDDTGTKQGGTPYWLPGDTHTSPARYTEDLGPLPDGALLEQPAAPPPTPDVLEAQFNAAVTARLNSFAAERQYDDITSARLASLSTAFKADGEIAEAAYDSTWTAAIALMSQVRDGSLSVDDAVGQLPALVWPDAEDVSS
jgi:hypothetical protein